MCPLSLPPSLYFFLTLSLFLFLSLPVAQRVVCTEVLCEQLGRRRQTSRLVSPAWALKDSSPGETPSIKRSSYLSRAPFTLCRKIKHERDSLTVLQNPSRILDNGAGSKSKAVVASRSSLLFARLGQTLIRRNKMTCNRLVAAQANVPLNYPDGLFEFTFDSIGATLQKAKWSISHVKRHLLYAFSNSASHGGLFKETPVMCNDAIIQSSVQQTQSRCLTLAPL